MSNQLGSFRWTVPPSTMASAIESYRERLLSAIHELLDVYGGRVVSYAMATAPWTDRTNNARSGLKHGIDEEGATIALVLYHTATYGLWLEIRWGGRWSVIMKTLEFHYPRLMAALAALVRG